MRNIQIVLVAAALLLSGCGSSDSSNIVPSPNGKLANERGCIPESELYRSGIVGGTQVAGGTSDVKKVMLLVVPEPGGQKASICTASALTRNILITAGHCVQGNAAESFIVYHESISCESGFDKRKDIVSVKEFVAHPDYFETGAPSSDDLALIILKNDIPFGYETYGVAAPESLDSQSLLLYGYGETGNGKQGSAILRKTEIPNQDFTIDSLAKKVVIDQTKGRGVCHGDSGGPGLINVNGVPQILGINWSVERAGGIELCQGKGYLTELQPYRSWLESELAKRGQFLKN
jgi:secreted trypsin-like serine protease